MMVAQARVLRGTGAAAAMIAFATWGATLVFACSATSTVDAARTAKDSDVYKSATDVAREVLDKAGVDSDVTKKVTDTWGSVTTTPVEAAVGTLLVEAGSRRLGTLSSSKYHTVTTGGVDAAGLRDILDTASTPIGSSHPTESTVRSHMLRHANDVLAGAEPTAEPEPVKESSPAKTPPSPSVPAAVDSVPPAAVPLPPSTEDHAG